MSGTIFLLLCFLSSVYTNYKEEWEKFKFDYGKSYVNPTEEAERYEIFQDNLRLIRQNNDMFENNKTTYKLGINQFADISQNEFASLLTFTNNYGNKKNNIDDSNRFDIRDGYCTGDEPEFFDWRDQNALTPVNDQRPFYDNNYSWAYSITAAVETQVYLAIHTLLSLSIQNMIDCVVPYQNETRWAFDFAFDYLLWDGILTEDEYPFTGSVDSCHQVSDGIRIGLYVNLVEECEIKTAVAFDGPVVVLIDATMISNYESGIIDNSLCTDNVTTHSVLVVGYGTENGVDYWILRNSWGPYWGETGHFRITSGNNTCGIALSPSYPIIVHN